MKFQKNREKITLLPAVALFALPLMRVKTVAAPSKDKQTLYRLDATLNPLSDKKAWFVKVERQLPPSQIPIWQRLQKQVPANSKHYAELSFMLAYYGVDYKANLRRIIRPYQLSKQSYERVKKEYPDTEFWDIPWTGWGQTWWPLNLLYLKHHDLTSLGFWLDQKLDGAPAEWNDDELGGLWDRHRTEMLRASSGSDIRLNNLAGSLTYAYVGGGHLATDKKEERKLLAELSRLGHADDPRVASAARHIYGKAKILADTWIRDETRREHIR